MIIFLDTNIFYNNWHLKNSNFTLLFNFLENTNATIWISDIVVDEIDNKFEQEKSEIVEISKKLKGKFFKLFNHDVSNDFELPEETYSFRKTLQSKTTNVVFYDYSDIETSQLVKRTIKKTKPFQNEDKGFRDTLIWLSFLNNLKKDKKNDEVSFINNNSSDFFNKNKTDLHEDLIEDLKFHGINNKFTMFSNLHSFVQNMIDKSQHTYSTDYIYDEYIHNQESQIEEEILNLLQLKENIDFIKLFQRTQTCEKILSAIVDFKFEIIEGIEDVYLINYEILNETKEIFIELNLDFRISEIEYILPTVVYNEFADYLDRNFQNHEIIDEKIKFYEYARVYFNISYTLDTDTEIIKDLVINQANMKNNYS